MADVQILASGVKPAPLAYTLPLSQEIILKALYAVYDGSSSNGDFVPVVRILSAAGAVVGEFPTQQVVSQGEAAEVSWGEGLGGEQSIAGAATILNVNISGSGVAQLVAASATKRIRVVQAAIMSAGTTAITFRSAANDLAGPYNLAAATGFVLGQSPLGYWAQTNINEALNLNNSLAIQVAGMIAYQVV